MRKNILVGILILAILASLLSIFFFTWKKPDMQKWYTAGSGTTEIDNISWSDF